MGKKARKTRWRTLSIEESPSDSESQPDTFKPRRWMNGTSHKYNYTSSSSHSTPQHHSRSYSTSNHHQQTGNHASNGGQSNGYQGARHKGYQSRSSSTTSEVKLTFNEEEYTKITTPRQDVLFKKGYLSKPKPYLQQQSQQQSLTSAGNSTGDGTPDHQSADGADYPENDVEVFYPPELFNPNLYYLNYDPATGAHPMLLYDQYGNTALCYPPPPAIQAYQPTTTEVPRNKRYSVDSVTESEATTDGGISDTYESTKVFPDVEVDKIEGGGEEIIRKKRKRRKEDGSGEKIVENEDNSVENQENPVQNGESGENTENLRVEAEEFIPRTFIPPQMNLIPVLPHELFPGGFVFMPPPAFYPPIPADIAAYPPNVEQLEEKGPIDIAKIVSKLEEAAREQKMMEEEEVEQNGEDNGKKVEINGENLEEKEQKIEKTNKNDDNEVKQNDVIKTNDTSIQANDDHVTTNENQVLETKQTVSVNNETVTSITEVKEVNNLCSKENEKTEKQNSSTLVDDIKSQNIATSHESIPTNKTEIPQGENTSTNNNLRYSDRLKKKPAVTTMSSTNMNTPPPPPLPVTTRQTRVKTGLHERQIQPRTCPRLDRQAKVNHVAKNGTQIRQTKLPCNGHEPSEKEINKIVLQSEICISNNIENITKTSLPNIGNQNIAGSIQNGIKTNNKKSTAQNNTPQKISTDQWISVSGKKKRKQKQSIETADTQTIALEHTDTPALPVEDPPKQPIPEVEVKTVECKQEQTNEVIENNEKSNKKEKTRSANKKQVKKRIIITDSALQLSDGVSPISPKVDAVGNTKETKGVQTEIAVVPQQEVKPEPEIPTPTTVTLKQTETTPTTNETKKSKKKKNKKHVQDLNNSCESSGDDINISNNNQQTVVPISEVAEDTDVSLELDRMIQRGLYSNLEQKLQYHNPGDSFLSTFQGNLFTTKLKQNNLPQFPSIVITQNQQSIIASKSPSPLSDTNEISFDNTHTQDISLGGLSITQAVREWMYRTRENTPEVEIFRKPQELNEEIISKVMDLEITETEHEKQIEDVEEVFEDGVEEIANDASLMTETHRSRSGSCDLSWDYDLPPVINTTTQPHTEALGPIDQAQDALETYESLYGQSRDFERIQNEVFGLRSNRRTGESLPYRAICCTVM